MEVRSFDFIKGNGFYSITPRHLLRSFRKPRARSEDEGMRGKPVMLSLHLVNPRNVSRPSVIAAFETDIHGSTADDALNANVHFTLAAGATVTESKTR
jgi:hypothetical protein